MCIRDRNRGFDMNTLVAFISASVSLITALLVIPTKIIEFIFNRDEMCIRDRFKEAKPCSSFTDRL